MKNKVFIIITILLAIGLLSSCSSCNDDGGLDKFEQLIVSTSSPEENREPFADAAYVVVPQNAGVELVSRAVSLAAALTEKTGVATFLKYDSEPTVSGTFEILLGYTSRLLSKENLGGLRDRDYICRYDRGCIILGGRTESATLEAIDKFESDILPGASYAAIMSKDAHFEVYAEPGDGEFSLNGHPIYEYTVAYCAESYEIAELLVRYLEERSGCALSYSQKQAYDPQTSKCIWLLLDDAGDGATGISAKDGNIVLSAPDLRGLSFAAATLLSEIGDELAASSTELTVEGSRILESTEANAEVGISFGFAGSSGEVTLDFLMDLADAINSAEDGLVCFCPVENSLAEDIRLNCPVSRTALIVEVGDGKSLPVLYRTSAFSSVSAERRDGTVRINAVTKDGRELCIRIDDHSGEPIAYEGGEILLLSGTRLGDGGVELVATAEYGSFSERVERRIYSDSVVCTDSETVAEYSDEYRYYGMLSVCLAEKYHESFIILKDTLK